MDIKRTITLTKIMQIYNDKTIYKIEQQTIVITFLASIEGVCISIVVRCLSHESIFIVAPVSLTKNSLRMSGIEEATVSQV